MLADVAHEQGQARAVVKGVLQAALTIIPSTTRALPREHAGGTHLLPCVQLGRDDLVGAIPWIADVADLEVVVLVALPRHQLREQARQLGRELQRRQTMGWAGLQSVRTPTAKREAAAGSQERIEPAAARVELMPGRKLDCLARSRSAFACMPFEGTLQAAGRAEVRHAALRARVRRGEPAAAAGARLRDEDGRGSVGRRAEGHGERPGRCVFSARILWEAGYTPTASVWF